MAQGLQSESKLKEVIEKSVDGKTAIRYKVVEEVIDLDALRREKEALEAQLAEKEPSEDELVEWGKMYHPFYQNKEQLNTRLVEIKTLLGE